MILIDNEIENKLLNLEYCDEYRVIRYSIPDIIDNYLWEYILEHTFRTIKPQVITKLKDETSK